MNDPRARVATSSQTVGPFFHHGLPAPLAGGMANVVATGERIRMVVRVTDGNGEPVEDALIELWYAGASMQDGMLRMAAGFGRLPTGEDGRCEFEMPRPAITTDGPGDRHAPYVNVCLFARGLLRQLHTRIYLADDPGLNEDAVLALVPEARRETLLARPDPDQPG
ncbi:MAG: protocatechuate 3,4-dioxygenase subunit alpha, partial [Acidobacteria bacterium]|nr:protocatechuate 3,4-dioxygenase subunit alpha [Acidobacteriota bacterium]